MKFSLGTPEHGWVELTITDDIHRFEVIVSNVPNDFINDTMIALSQLLTYENKRQVWLSLEPDYYLMSLARQTDVFTITIDKGVSASNVVYYQASGDFKEVILPIYRSLKSFYNSRNEDLHWPAVNQMEFQNMLEAVALYKG